MKLSKHHIERFPVGDHSVRLISLAGLADGVMEFGPFLGRVLGFEQVAYGAEAVGVALAGLG